MKLIFAAAFLSCLSNCGGGRPMSSVKIPTSYTACETSSLVVRQMAFSLESEPNAWDTDAYWVWRNGGGAIWIANEAYGIAIGPAIWHTGKVSNPNDANCLYDAYRKWVMRPERFQ